MDIESILTKNTPINATTDYELILQVHKGNVGAFELIMRRYNQRLFRIARSILREDDEAMDVVQEAYLKAYSHLEQFKGPDGFTSWISKITRNEAMMRIRKSKRIEYTLDDFDDSYSEMESSELQPVEQIANQQLRKLLEQAIDALSMDYRSVYVMRAIEQLSTAETAKVLELNEDLVKTRYLRAKRVLQKTLAVQFKTVQLEAFEFAGERCDAIVNNVLTKLLDISLNKL